jgi:hypothetical protein
MVLGLVSQILLHANGQGFINLDFESANLPVLAPGQYGGLVPLSDALPGWRVFYGANITPESTLAYNGITLGTRNASILGPNFEGEIIIEGQFMPFLQTGVAPLGESGTVAIEQTGIVPTSAQSLQFKVGINNQIGVGFDTNFSLSLNGQSLSLVPLGAMTNYATYGVDVTRFAGQVADLRFTSYGTVIRPLNWVAVDSFQFLPMAVPEPSTWALLALGSALFWCAKRRRTP